MANSVTNLGQEYALYGTVAPNGSLANLITAIKLYAVGSTPNKNGSGFTEVAIGNGYSAGGFPVTRADWSLIFIGPDRAIRLGDILVTAVGGSIPNILGAYAVDAGNNPLVWWERTTGVTLAPGDDLVLDDLTIRSV